MRGPWIRTGVLFLLVLAHSVHAGERTKPQMEPTTLSLQEQRCQAIADIFYRISQVRWKGGSYFQGIEILRRNTPGMSTTTRDALEMLIRHMYEGQWFTPTEERNNFEMACKQILGPS